MLQTQIQPLAIVPSDGGLSKGQKAFNSQIRQIEKLRAQIAAWEAAVPSYLKKYTRELLPLVEVAKEWNCNSNSNTSTTTPSPD